MKWYRAVSYSNEIKSREVVKETAKQITYITEDLWGAKTRKQRVAKTSYYDSWFKTEKEAIDFKRAGFLHSIELAKNHVKFTEDQLEKFNELYPEKK